MPFAPEAPMGRSAAKSACGSASKRMAAKQKTKTGRAMSATRPMLLNPFVQAKKHSAKKGAKEMTGGTFSYSSTVTKFFCSISGKRAERAKKSPKSP